MYIKDAFKKSASTIIFAIVTGGVFWLAQEKLINNVIYSASIAIMAAIVLTYFYNRYVYSDTLRQLKHMKNTTNEENVKIAREFYTRHKRLEEKVRKLTSELSSSKLKLQAEIADRPLDQRKLQQRLKHLNCLYGLSKIVNRQEIPLEQIFQESVHLIRDAYQYPDAICVRITFDGLRYKTDNFEKTELSRQTKIKASGKNAGLIEVYYLGAKAEKGEELFLKEEDDLLNAVAGWLGSTAERKKGEEKLRLFRNLIEGSNDCIFAIEPKWGRFLDANNRACVSLGYTQKELLNMMTIKNIEESIPDDSLWQKQVQELRNKGDVVKQGRFRRKDGTTFFVETSLKLVAQEKQDYIIAIARDITERKKAEAELRAAQEKLLATARKVGMAEVATGVLHNAGNVLNSVSVTAESIQKSVRNSKVSYLTDVVELLNEHTNDIGTFMTTQERGKKLPAFLTNLAKELTEEQEHYIRALEELTRHVQHVADIIQLQQSHSKTKGLVEPVFIAELVEDAIKINADPLTQHHIKVRREIAQLPSILLDRHKVLQMLTNLISNANYALSKSEGDARILTIRVKEPKGEYIRIEVCDNGIGIPKENLTRIFEHGFTTKKKGHGFGLHSTALSANEMNGSLIAYSDGPGKGAVFTIELPFNTQEAKK